MYAAAFGSSDEASGEVGLGISAVCVCVCVGGCRGWWWVEGGIIQYTWWPFLEAVCPKIHVVLSDPTQH